MLNSASVADLSPFSDAAISEDSVDSNSISCHNGEASLGKERLVFLGRSQGIRARIEGNSLMRLLQPEQFAFLAAHMDPHFEFEIFPGTIGGVNLRLGRQGELKAREAPSESLTGRVWAIRFPAMLARSSSKRNDLLDWAGPMLPCLLRGPAATH